MRVTDLSGFAFSAGLGLTWGWLLVLTLPGRRYPLAVVSTIAVTFAFAAAAAHGGLSSLLVFCAAALTSSLAHITWLNRIRAHSTTR